MYKCETYFLNVTKISVPAPGDDMILNSASTCFAKAFIARKPSPSRMAFTLKPLPLSWKVMMISLFLLFNFYNELIFVSVLYRIIDGFFSYSEDTDGKNWVHIKNHQHHLSSISRWCAKGPCFALDSFWCAAANHGNWCLHHAWPTLFRANVPVTLWLNLLANGLCISFFDGGN